MDYYTEISEGYEELHKEEQLKKLEVIKKYLKVKPLLLDIGCGTGLGLKFFNVESKGIDPSEGLIKNNKDCVKGKAEEIPFEDNLFSTIISITALHHCNIDEAIKEIKRVSKADCVYAFTILRKAKNCEEIVKKLQKEFDLKRIEENKKDIILISQT